MYAKAAKVGNEEIRYSDAGSYRWLWTDAPCSWQNNVQLQFLSVGLGSLHPAGCWIDPAIVAAHLQHMRRGRAVPPVVVCADGDDGWYIHDGNHRYHALRSLFCENDDADVRVAVAVPNVGFRFVYRWFGMYGTYLLEPVPPLLERDSFRGRTMVLVAHQDDETACAGLLQRMTDPVVVHATNGAPNDKYFWSRYGSPSEYALVRRREAEAALRKIGVESPNCLNDRAPSTIEFRDQQLYRVLPEAFDAVSDLVCRYQPSSVLVRLTRAATPTTTAAAFWARCCVGALHCQFGRCRFIIAQ